MLNTANLAAALDNLRTANENLTVEAARAELASRYEGRAFGAYDSAPDVWRALAAWSSVRDDATRAAGRALDTAGANVLALIRY